MSQTLYFGKRKVEVIRVFHKDVNCPPLLFTKEGNYEYPNGEFPKSKAELDWLPEPYKTQALAWFKKRAKKAPKEAKEEVEVEPIPETKEAAEAIERDEELYQMPIPQLQILAGSSREDRDELIKIIHGEDLK